MAQYATVTALTIFSLVVGIVCLVGGVSDLVIGLTVVAIGTSLPELATSIPAATVVLVPIVWNGFQIKRLEGSC